MLTTVSRYQAAKLLSRQSGSLRTTHAHLCSWENAGVITRKTTRKHTTDYGPVELLQARVALALYDFGVTSVPVLRSLVGVMKRGKRDTVISLSAHDGSALKVTLPIQRYEREIREALDGGR
jgi:hypothetical protein